MGQYYNFMNIDKKQTCNKNKGMLKLLEHSYLRNDYCNDILSLLSNEWKNNRILHVGDYAEENDETTTCNIIKKVKEEFNTPKTIYEYSDEFDDVDLSKNESDKKIRYVYNNDKKEYLDLFKQPIQWFWIDKNKIGFAKINSFALAVACGNGLGGGDYRNLVNENKVGMWAGDYLESSIEFLEEYNNYKENNIVFNEELKTSKEYWDSNSEYIIAKAEAEMLDKELLNYAKNKNGDLKKLSIVEDGLTPKELSVLNNQLTLSIENIKDLSKEDEVCL